MKIKALQKLTLLDFPGRTACTVFTFGCNLRCPFCHNAQLVLGENNDGEYISEEEFFKFLKKRSGLLDGVCVTGGEPLLQPEIETFLKKIKEYGFLVKLDTNGFFPERLERIIKAELVDYIAMDIKSAPENYAFATGLEHPDVDAVKRSVEIIRKSGVTHEFRTTLVKGIHTKSDLDEIGNWLCGEKNYFLQMYIDSGDLVGELYQTINFSAFSKDELESLAEGLNGKVNYTLRGI